MAGVSIRGELTLIVDEFGLEAAFRFSPSQEGREWSSDGLAKALAEARVVGVQGRRIDEMLQAFSKSREPRIEVAAKGLPPELGIPEAAEWADFETPPEYAAFADETIAEAPRPDLFRIKVERVAKERVVKKPGALPFLPAREEKVVEYEKVEVREPVAVDTRVLRHFWAPKGAVVARSTPSRPGKAGKNVYGKPIQPPASDDTAFHLGKGLARGKGEITTEAAGFIRVGAHWADLVPFGAGEHSIRLSEDGATVLLDYTPGDKRLPPPDAEAILSEAVALGQAPEHLIPVEEATKALLRATRSGQALYGFSLSGDRDGSASVEVTPDKLKATLSVIKGRGSGKPLELAMVSAALAGHRLKGVKIDKLKADVIAFYKGKETELLDYPLAFGKDPVKGKDRSLVFNVAFLPVAQAKEYVAAMEAAPALSRFAKSLDEFPLTSVERVAIVKKDEEVARFSPPSLGQAGVDVYGATIPAAPGNDPVVRTFENLRVSQESIASQDDGIFLVADDDDMTKARVLPYRDASVEVRVAEDAMSATVDIAKGYGLGRELTLELAQASLAEAGVVAGVDLKELSAALAEAREGRPVSGRTIARGAEPVPAGGYRLNWLIRIASGAAVTVRADGSADYKNQDRSTIVVEGQPLLELLAIGVEGQDGQDVLGGAIPAPKDPRVSEPPGFDDSVVEERKENGDRLLKAAKNGELRFEKNALSIDQSHRIKGDVGPATGNVRFPGPVAVAGTVLTGYAIVAAGDVLVTGAVEAALVSADGSVKITEGIKGAKRGTVRARKNIEASFAEQAMLLAVEDIVLKNSAMLCNIKTNGHLRLLGEKGHLIGGLCRSRKGIEVQNLGSANGSRTQVSFGQDYLVQDAIEAEEREIERVKAMVLQADKTMREQEKAGVNLDKIRQDKLRLVKLLEKRSLRVFELREKFEEHFPGEIVVRGSVFAGVVIESHNRFHEVRQTKQKVAFSFDPQLGRVVERPLK
ncbi:MAG: FapA family protein [Spirochaetes bacterium]|nr:FapA family protein [Spirochaetota bacterium]MBU1082128.1 FapA family protein [Spirochaetota bacterium]